MIASPQALSSIRRRRIPTRVPFAFAAAFTAMAMAVPQGQAADISWDGTTGPFTTGTNWVGDVAPGTSDNAIINNGGTATITTGDVVGVSRLLLDNGTVTQTGGSISTVPFGNFESPGAYQVGGVSGQTGTYNASGASTLTGGRARIGINGGTGAVTLSGSSAYNGAAGQDTWFGNGNGSVGSLTLNDSAQWNINNDWLVVGRNGGQGTVTLSSTAQLNVANGNILFGDGVGDAPSTGEANLSGTAAIKTTGGEIWVGQNGGTGTVNLSGNATLTAENNWIAVGRFANGGSHGTVTISDNAQFKKIGNNNGNIVIGADAVGTVTVKDNGTFSSNTQIWVGEGDDADGTLNIQGGTVSTGGDFVTAQGGGSIGATNLSGGTVNVGGWTKMGFNANAAGTLNITGGQLNTTGSLIVGDSGSGVLTMQNGTVVTNGDTWIGQSGPGTGVFNMEGGSYSSGTWVAVGREGAKGTLNVSGGTFSHTGTGAITTALDGVSSLTGNNFVVLGSASKVAVVNHTGGTINNSASALLIGENGGANGEWTASGGTANLAAVGVGFNGVGVLTISGSANYTATDVKVAVNTGGNGSVLNLNGGTLTANSITKGLGGGTVNFNGGVLKAGASSETFISGVTANVLAGGITVDTNGFDDTITVNLSGIGGLTKTGDGILTLSGAQSYTGNTSILDGTLSIDSIYLADSSNVLISTGGVFDLATGGSDLIQYLIVNGVIQAAGTYGAIGSGAQYEVSYLTGDGFLVTAVPEPGHYALGIAALLGAMIVLRRRRALTHQA